MKITQLAVIVVLLGMTVGCTAQQPQYRRPYGYGSYGQSPLYEANRQLTELERLQQTVRRLKRN